MKVVHVGCCESESCARFDGDRSRLWLHKGKRLCWFCWRRELGVRISLRSVALFFGQSFADMVQMAMVERRPAA